MATGQWGMSETIGKRMLLARKVLQREFMQWDSKEQKADVLTLAEYLKVARRQLPSEPMHSDSDPQTRALMQKLLGGVYDIVRPKGEKDVLGHVARHTDRNESYFPGDAKSLLDTVRSILPVEQKLGGRREGKREVKA